MEELLLLSGAQLASDRIKSGDQNSTLYGAIVIAALLTLGRRLLTHK